jgi:hypothetical protein
MTFWVHLSLHTPHSNIEMTDGSKLECSETHGKKCKLQGDLVSLFDRVQRCRSVRRQRVGAKDLAPSVVEPENVN